MRDQRLLMQALEGLADGELTQECADCGLDLYVTTTALPFIASDQDATSKAPARTTPLMRPSAPNPIVHATAAIARRAELVDVAGRVDGLDSIVLCPACGARFPLLS